MPLAPGSRLGPYEILAPIGAGGMGEVYRAKDPRLGREVAIKVLPASFSADADRLRRFEQEAKAAGILNHPNLTAAHDIGTHDGSPYVVQELLEGETLRSVLGRLRAGRVQVWDSSAWWPRNDRLSELSSRAIARDPVLGRIRPGADKFGIPRPAGLGMTAYALPIRGR
jgi:serine/threonine protein kinase